MARITQRDALGTLTKVRLLEVSAALGLNLPGQTLKPTWPRPSRVRHGRRSVESSNCYDATS